MRVRRKKRKNKLIVILIILLLGISAGYARFSTNLNVVGTATANGNFSIEFTSSKITDAKGIDAINSKAIISDAKDTLTINIKDMAYPGAGATILCNIKNTGTIPAKLNGVTFTGNDDPDISISFPDNLIEGQHLGVNESISLKFIVKWNIDSTLNKTKAVNFTATLEYVQDTTDYES